jgi:hypothetical protein
VNNSVYRTGGDRIFMVSDLGAAFGAASRIWPRNRSKDNLDAYSQSKFIRRITSSTVDFQTPARPTFVYLIDPKSYVNRVHIEHVGQNVPRADAKWLGQLLARLSPAQLHDAFGCAGYSPEEIEILVKVLAGRISALTDL